jgi:hypothetical protein
MVVPRIRPAHVVSDPGSRTPWLRLPLSPGWRPDWRGAGLTWRLNVQTMFERIAGMAGVAPPDAAARLLLDHIARVGRDEARRTRGQDEAWARAEAAKWFFHYRRRDVPSSIAAYMAEVETLYRSATTGREPAKGPSLARL